MGSLADLQLRSTLPSGYRHTYKDKAWEKDVLFYENYAESLTVQYFSRDAYRDAVESLIQRYFLQLTKGCGHKDCSNPNCATGSGKPVDPNKAAAVAIALAQRKKKGHLCVSSGPSNKNNLAKNSVSAPAMVPSKPTAVRSPGPSIPHQPSEPMDTTDSSTGGVEPSSSTDSASSSTLILVTSGAVLEPEPVPPRKQLPASSSTGLEDGSSSRENVSMEVSPSPSAKKQVEETPASVVPSVLGESLVRVSQSLDWNGGMDNTR